MNRRNFLKFAAAGTAGLILPERVAAEPERRFWSLDKTMVAPRPLAVYPNYPVIGDYPGIDAPQWLDVGHGRVFINGVEVEIRSATPVLTLAEWEAMMRGMWEPAGR